MHDTKIILESIKANKCSNVLKELSILAEEQMENKAMDDLYSYYQNSPINKYPNNLLISTSSLNNSSMLGRLQKLKELMNISEGYKFQYLDNYFLLTANELEMLNNLKKYKTIKININEFQGSLPDLHNKNVTFVGAGFPLSGLSINILTGAKINLIDIDNQALQKAKNFLLIIAKAGIININDFTFTIANGEELSYSENKLFKTDILHLASALPRTVKINIFNKITSENNKDLVIIDRYVSGIFKTLYDNKVLSKDIPKFKTIAKIYPENLYFEKIKNLKYNIIVKPTNIMNVNSSRLLIKLK